VRNPRIFDVEIEVDLLRAAVRPIRGHMVRCELHADPPLTSRVNDAVPTLVLEDAPSEDPGPKCALGMYVRCVEHNNLTHHSHDRIIEIVIAGGQLTLARRLGQAEAIRRPPPDQRSIEWILLAVIVRITRTWSRPPYHW
jgi:hypothetical protein